MSGPLLDRLKSAQGHIVIRVDPGGDIARIIFDDSAESYRVKRFTDRVSRAERFLGQSLPAGIRPARRASTCSAENGASNKTGLS